MNKLLGVLLILLIVADVLAAVFGIISAVASAGFFFKYIGSYDWDYAAISASATTIAAYIAAVCIRDLVGSEYKRHD